MRSTISGGGPGRNLAHAGARTVARAFAFVRRGKGVEVENGCLAERYCAELRASAPILTVNWKASSGEQWTVPLGGGVGKIFHLGKLPVNTQVSAYYNVAKPDFGPNWQIRAQVQLMFPK